MQARRNVERNKPESFSCFSVIHPGNVNEVILKLTHDVVVGHIMFRENDDTRAGLHFLDRFLKRPHDAHVMVNTNAVGIVEDADGKRRDHIG